jgi:hypothetical protein
MMFEVCDLDRPTSAPSNTVAPLEADVAAQLAPVVGSRDMRHF